MKIIKIEPGEEENSIHIRAVIQVTIPPEYIELHIELHKEEDEKLSYQEYGGS